MLENELGAETSVSVRSSASFVMHAFLSGKAERKKLRFSRKLSGNER